MNVVDLGFPSQNLHERFTRDEVTKVVETSDEITFNWQGFLPQIVSCCQMTQVVSRTEKLADKLDYENCVDNL